MNTAVADILRFNSTLNSTSDLSCYNLMLHYVMLNLKNRIPPEIGISGISGTIKLDALLQHYIGKPIDNSEIKDVIGSLTKMDEMNYLIEKIMNSDSEFNLTAKEYGKAIAICMANEYGKHLTASNFKSYGNHIPTYTNIATEVLIKDEIFDFDR